MLFQLSVYLNEVYDEKEIRLQNVEVAEFNLETIEEEVKSDISEKEFDHIDKFIINRRNSHQLTENICMLDECAPIIKMMNNQNEKMRKRDKCSNKARLSYANSSIDSQDS